MELTIKPRLTGIQAQEAGERRAPWTESSVNDRWNLLLKLDKLVFELSKQGREDLPGLIRQSMINGTYY